jgi:hypothetical protein
MYLNINETVKQNKLEKSNISYKLYNLLFSGKITIQEYLKTLQTLKDDKENN